MKLSSLQLEAFIRVARLLHFTGAAKELGLTQSALSRRIALLEEDLATPLFLREGKAVRLTDAGRKLLRYCEVQEELEQEFMGDWRSEQTEGGLAGVLRVGAYSSVGKSKVLPALAPFLRENPRIDFSYACREVRELCAGLMSGEYDLIFTDFAWKHRGVELAKVGEEVYWAYEAKGGGGAPNVLDHDAEDRVSDDYFSDDYFDLQPSALQKRFAKPHRLYLDDVDGLIEGAALGLGVAVLPEHLVAGDSRLRKIPGAKPRKMPIYLARRTQPVRSQLHQAAHRRLFKL